MNRTIVSAVAFASALSLAPSSTRETTMDPPAVKLIMQNTRTVEWITVPRATVAQRSSRKVRLVGPWLDYVTSVTSSNGITARNFEKADRQITMILDASASAARGDMTLKLNITCPVVAFDCKPSVTLPLKVFETGPVRTIQPYGTVPPNAAVTFDLTGEALDVAKLLPRLVTLTNAVILSRTATTMQVRGTTPSCGSIDVALTDVADGDEFPYRRESTVQAVVAGTICGQSTAPPLLKTGTGCSAGQVWDPTLKSCKTG
jgi:hypothetical protein